MELLKDRIGGVWRCFVALLVFFQIVVAVTVPVTGFAAEDDVLWQSGKNQRVELVSQERSLKEQTRPNQHPVELDEKQLAHALDALRIWEKGYFSEQKLVRVFSPNQRRVLARAISQGLARAEPDQELIFSLAGGVDKDTGLSFFGHSYIAGRVFYLDDRLQFIIGNFRRSKDKGAEAMAGQFGEYEITYRFNHGRRAGRSRLYTMNSLLANVAGIEQMGEGDKIRRDWLLVDVEAAAQVVLSEERERVRKTPTGENRQALEQAARERLELRAEMARMRKRMQNLTGEQGVPAGVSDIKSRMHTLEQLREDGLISQEEYEQRRQKILDDI